MINNIHQPRHIYLDNTDYFISVHTYNNLPIFSDARKEEVLKLLSALLKKYNYELFVYAILKNHYHLLLKVLEAKYLPDIFKNLHGSLSYTWNGEDNLRGRNIFQSYWDYCIRDDKDFWTHFNYIHQNPIKHGLVNNLEELKDYKFCSYGSWLEKKGVEWMSEVWAEYPVVNYIIPND